MEILQKNYTFTIGSENISISCVNLEHYPTLFNFVKSVGRSYIGLDQIIPKHLDRDLIVYLLKDINFVCGDDRGIDLEFCKEYLGMGLNESKILELTISNMESLTILDTKYKHPVIKKLINKYRIGDEYPESKRRKLDRQF